MAEAVSSNESRLVINGNKVVEWTVLPQETSRIVRATVKDIFLGIRESERNISHMKRWLDANDLGSDVHIWLDENMKPMFFKNLHVDRIQCHLAVFGYVANDEKDIAVVKSDKFRVEWPSIVEASKKLGQILDRNDLYGFLNWDQNSTDGPVANGADNPA